MSRFNLASKHRASVASPSHEFSGVDSAFRVKRFQHAVDHTDTLDWWLNEYLPLNEENAPENMKAAVKKRRIHMLDWIEQKGVLPRVHNITCSHADCAYWLHERVFTLAIEMNNAILKSELAFLNWCYDNRHLHEIMGLSGAIVVAADTKKLEISQWVTD